MIDHLLLTPLVVQKVPHEVLFAFVSTDKPGEIDTVVAEYRAFSVAADVNFLPMTQKLIMLLKVFGQRCHNRKQLQLMP